MDNWKIDRFIEMHLNIHVIKFEESTEETRVILGLAWTF